MTRYVNDIYEVRFERDRYNEERKAHERTKKLKKKWHARAKRSEAALREIRDSPDSHDAFHGHYLQRVAREALETDDG